MTNIKLNNNCPQALVDTKDMEEKIDRTKKLASRFNDFWNRIFQCQEDYFTKLSIGDFVRLKMALSDINNILTLELSLKFLDRIKAYKIISDSQYEEAMNKINSINPNTNGYDIFIEPSQNYKGIIAEVKCNVPVGEKKYGAAQLAGIQKDIKGLKDPHAKTKRPKEMVSSDEFYKFMVLFDCKDFNGNKDVTGAVQQIINKNTDIELLSDSSKFLDTKKVYIILLN